MFNTLKYAKQLESVGLTRDQAETHMEIMTEVIETTLATKQDIKDLRHEMLQMEQRLTIKLGTIVTIALGAAITLGKILL